MKKSQFCKHLFFLQSILFVLGAGDVWAAAPLVPAVNLDPGRVSTDYLPKQRKLPQAAPKITPPEEKAQSLGPEAEEIKFKLNKIILEGNHVYSSETLQKLYQKQIGKEISIADLQQIVQDITNYYRNNGYILTRAILPPQHVVNGEVKVRVMEGYIHDVHVVGKARGSRKLLLAYGKKIAASHPTQVKVMERYLRLANDVPGVQVKAVLEPSKTTVGASDLNLVVEEQPINASFSYDNYGTRYIGPLQLTGILSANSIFRSGDTTRYTYLTDTNFVDLHYYDIAYDTPLGSEGMRFTVGGNRSTTNPKFTLEPLDVHGIAETYYGNLFYPMIRSRSKNLTLDTSFTYLDSKTTTLGELLYLDHIRSLRAGGNYNFSDSWYGLNNADIHLEEGLNILGASNDPNSLTTSRFGADGIFTKWNVQLSRSQQITDRFSAFVLMSGQYSYNPLLASEQFGFGGSQLGRGYDPAEILGDRGLAGSAEIRYDLYPQWRFLNVAQPYIFYDIGKIWNLRNLPDSPMEASAASTGFGVRFYINKYMGGNIMFTQPLTKEVAAQDVIGQGRSPREYFSLTAIL